MVSVRKNIFIEFDEEISVERMEIDVDNADEIPAVDFFEGKRLHQGSIAWVISTGEFYGLNGDGEWINQSNPDTATASEPTAMSAPTMMRMSAVKPETVEEVVEDEKSLRNTESDENRLLD